MSEPEKTCTGCGKVKTLKCFYPDKTKEDGKMDMCMICYRYLPGKKTARMKKATQASVKRINNGVRYNNKTSGERTWHREDGKVIDLTGAQDKKGKFTKGNQYGAVSSKRAYSNSPAATETKAAIKNAMTTEEAKELFQSLRHSRNDNVRLKALEMWLHYNYGKPTQHIEQEVTTRTRANLPEEVLNALHGEDKDGTNDQ